MKWSSIRRQVFSVGLVLLVAALAFFFSPSPSALGPSAPLDRVASAAPAEADVLRARELRQQAVRASVRTAVEIGSIEAKLLECEAALSKWLLADSAGKGRLGSDVEAQLRSRRVHLKRLMELSPREAMTHVLSAATRAELPTEWLPLVEKPIEAMGKLAVVQGCFGAERPVERWFMRAGEKYDTYVYGQREATLSKDILAIYGYAIDQTLVLGESPYLRLVPGERPGTEDPRRVWVSVGGTVQSFSSEAQLKDWEENMIGLEHSPDPAATTSTLAPLSALGENEPKAKVVSEAPASAWTVGPKKVLVVRVDFSDLPGDPVSSITPDVYTADYCRNLMDSTIAPFYAASSYGKTSIETTVTRLYRLPKTASTYAEAGDLYGLMVDSEAASAGEYTLTNYDRYVVVFSYLGGLSGSKLGAAGWGGGRTVWINGYFDFRVVAHELGHAWGLMHAASWNVSDQNPVSPSGFGAEYGDPFDVMGGANTTAETADFNPSSKNEVGWLTDAEVTTLSASGDVRLAPFDLSTSGLPKALKVGFDDTRTYWVGLRRKDPSQHYNFTGASFTWDFHTIQTGFGGGFRTALLDMSTPGSPPPGQWDNHLDSALPLGSPFVDTAHGITFTLMENTGSAASTSSLLRVHYGAGGSNRDPILAWTTAPTSGTARKDVNLAFSASDPDGDSLVYRWDFDDGTESAIGSAVTHRWAKGGSYTVKVSAVDGKGGRAELTHSVQVDDPLSQVSLRHSTKNRTQISDVVFSGTQFAAVSWRSLLFSPDGVTWDRPTLLGLGEATLDRISFGQNRWVVCGYEYLDSGLNLVLAWSENGATWHRANHPVEGRRLKSLAYGPAGFVGVGEQGLVLRSSDGQTWTKVDLGLSTDLNCVSQSDGVYIAGGSNGRVFTSTDTLSWTSYADPTVLNAVYSIGRFGGEWMTLLGVSGLRSVDGSSWTRFYGDYYYSTSIAAEMGAWVAASWSRDLSFSEDGVTWAPLVLNAEKPEYVSALAAGNGTIVAATQSGALYQIGVPAEINPHFLGIETGASVEVGRAVDLRFSGGSAYASYELEVDGVVVARLNGNEAPFVWVPPSFGAYRLVVVGVTADGSRRRGAAVTVQAARTGVWQSVIPALPRTKFVGVVPWQSGRLALGEGGTTLWVGGDGSRRQGRVAAVFQGRALATDGVLAVAVGASTLANNFRADPIKFTRDGVTWEPARLLPPDFFSTPNFSDLATANGRWVAVGNYVMATSSDGIEWTTVESWDSGPLNAVAYGAGRWVAVGWAGTLRTSTDGMTWESHTIDGTAHFTDVSFGAGRWLAVEANGAWTSNDGLTWSRAGSVSGEPFNWVCYADGLFWACSYDSVFQSTDGQSWNLVRRLMRGVDFVSASDGESLDVLGAADWLRYSAIDGWRSVVESTFAYLSSIARFKGRWIVSHSGYNYPDRGYGTPLLWSENGTEWHEANAAYGADHSVIKVLLLNPDSLLAVGSKGRVYRSSDGKTWSDSVPGGSLSRSSLVGAETMGADLYVLAGDGKVFRLDSGATWTQVIQLPTDYYRALRRAGDRLFALGSTGSLWSSLDGSTWTMIDIGSAYITAVAYTRDSGYVATTWNGDTYVSTDGFSWTQRPNPGRGMSTLVAGSRGLMGFVPYAGATLFSRDGVTWVQERLPFFRNPIIDSVDADGECVAIDNNGGLFRYAAPPHVKGDFDDDGRADVLQRADGSEAVRIFLNRGAAEPPAVFTGLAGEAWEVSAMGDFNADRSDDLVWSNRLTGERGIWLLQQGRFQSWVSLGKRPSIWRLVGTGDFDGDGSVDLVWQNGVTGVSEVWPMAGTARQGSPVALTGVNTEWAIVGVADFDGDGAMDLLWRSRKTGQVVIWTLHGTTFAESHDLAVAGAEWRIAQVGDFDGDGDPDILWQNLTGQILGFWALEGTRYTGHFVNLAAPDSGSRIGWGRSIFTPERNPRVDFNRDGRADVMWSHETSGQRVGWLLDGLIYRNYFELDPVAPVWRLAAMGDLNHDGHTDLVWENSDNGERVAWWMDEGRVIGSISYGAVPKSWRTVGMADLNQDGNLDLVFQNSSTGAVVGWLLDRGAYQTTSVLAAVPPEWELVAVGDLDLNDQPDFIWRNRSTGEVGAWFREAGGANQWLSWGLVGPEWTVAGCDDFSGDSLPDLLWQNRTTGARGIWRMDHGVNPEFVSMVNVSGEWLLKN